MLYYKGNNFEIFTNKTSTCLFVILQRTKSVFRNHIIYHPFNFNDKNNKKTLQSNVNHPLADGCIGNIFNMSVWGCLCMVESMLYKFQHVHVGRGDKGAGPCRLRSKLNKFKHSRGSEATYRGGGGCMGTTILYRLPATIENIPSHNFVGRR